jgi:acetyl/propionyl-CoA carboxylase alpha subunit
VSADPPASRDLLIRVGGEDAVPAAGWRLTWVDRPHGVARLDDGEHAHLALVEGAGSSWTVTLRGRRIGVSVLTWRERVLADAEVAGRRHGGPVDVKATLPGLVVALAVGVGDEVATGDRLLTIEAMKMQNEVLAPRDGRVVEVAVEAGRAVSTGQLLVRME